MDACEIDWQYIPDFALILISLVSLFLAIRIYIEDRPRLLVHYNLVLIDKEDLFVTIPYREKDNLGKGFSFIYADEPYVMVSIANIGKGGIIIAHPFARGKNGKKGVFTVCSENDLNKVDMTPKFLASGKQQIYIFPYTKGLFDNKVKIGVLDMVDKEWDCEINSQNLFFEDIKHFDRSQ